MKCVLSFVLFLDFESGKKEAFFQKPGREGPRSVTEKEDGGQRSNRIAEYKLCLTHFTLVLFIYQYWRTIACYLMAISI